jgi:capsular polysaccharide biosynthesis protein
MRALPLILLFGVAAAGTAVLVSKVALSDRYVSTATVIIKATAPLQPAADSPVYRVFASDQSIGATFEQLAKQPAVMAEAASQLRVSQSAFRTHARAHSIPKTPLVQLSYTADTANGAANGASVYARSFLDSTKQMPWLPAQVSPVSAPVAADAPSGPRTGLNTVVAALAAILLGLGIAVFREYLRTLPSFDDATNTSVLVEPVQTQGGDQVNGDNRLRPHQRRLRV